MSDKDGPSSIAPSAGADVNPQPSAAESIRAVAVGEIEIAYADWLGGKSPALRRRFAQNGATDPHGGRAEAAVWWFLEHMIGHRVEPGDTGEAAGPDFDCFSREAGEFLFSVEVTAIRDEAFDAAAGVTRTSESVRVTSGDVSSVVWEAVNDKVRQAKTRTGSVLVAVGSTSEVAWIMLRRHAAETLHTGRQSVVIPRGAGGASYRKTDLENSAFYVADPLEGVAGFAEAVAGALLVAVSEGGVHVCGAVNPGATHPLNLTALRGVPFARSVTDQDTDSMQLEWVVGAPEPLVVRFSLPPGV
jgi:hypothetical protein